VVAILRRAYGLLVLLALACAGCTHYQLSHSTVEQAGTITDLHYKQVLSNLASSHCNPNVLPHFAVVGTGGALVNDQGSVNVELEWDPRTIIRELMGVDAARQVELQWTLAPVVNPDKLRAIRCLFQLVVLGETTDPEADKLLKAFLGEGYMEWVQRGWYGVGSRSDVPKGACYVGHCGVQYVWVMPDDLEALSRLTLVVLNVATLDPTPLPTQPTKTVQKYKYKDGQLEMMETFTRPDPDALKPTAPPPRQDFYNPLQSQIQLRGKGR
jgi:hypothetical protein